MGLLGSIVQNGLRVPDSQRVSHVTDGGYYGRYVFGVFLFLVKDLYVYCETSVWNAISTSPLVETSFFAMLISYVGTLDIYSTFLLDFDTGYTLYVYTCYYVIMC